MEKLFFFKTFIIMLVFIYLLISNLLVKFNKASKESLVFIFLPYFLCIVCIFFILGNNLSYNEVVGKRIDKTHIKLSDRIILMDENYYPVEVYLSDRPIGICVIKKGEKFEYGKVDCIELE